MSGEKSVSLLQQSIAILNSFKKKKKGHVRWPIAANEKENRNNKKANKNNEK